MHSATLNMHQNCFRLGLCPGPRLESLRHSPTTLVGWLSGCLSSFPSSMPLALRFLTPSIPIQIPGYTTTRYAPPVKKFWLCHCCLVNIWIYLYHIPLDFSRSEFWKGMKSKGLKLQNCVPRQTLHMHVFRRCRMYHFHLATMYRVTDRQTALMPVAYRAACCTIG